MKFAKYFSWSVISLVSFALVEVTFSLNANAGMIATSTAVADISRGANRAKVDAFMQRQEVRAEMMKRGVNPDEAAQRVANLSDFELQNLAGKIDSAPAGADVVVISLTTLLLIVIILLLIAK